MTRLIRRLAATTLLAATALMASLGLAHAQGDPAVDPPGRVARLAEFSGQVWLYSPDTGEWVSAVRNQPVGTGDRLATDRDGRVELQLGSTTLRLDSNSELEVTALDDERLALQLESGSAYVRVPDLANTGALELTTDDGRFVVQRNGNYRFDREGSTSRITVYSGAARYEGSNSGLPVSAGQRAEFWIDSGGVAQYTLSAPVGDAFAAWNNDRDRREPTGGTALRYVSPEMTGAEDLDRYGRWEQSPDYGPLWIPTAVAVDWAPYRTGHWAWVRPWGWTWIDDAPWGFAPFHYGRWVYVRNNWCWAPGNRVVRPVYAPALVAWMGSPRGGVSVRVGGGPAVGWFPLAPREVYVPSYRVSPRYARDVNIGHVTNVTVINNVFANPQGRRDFDNRRWPGAVTVVPAGVMSGRQPVAPAAAQMRNNPQARELFAAQQPGHGPAPLIAAPVAPPPAVRAADPRTAVRPPPGFAERPASPRPGFVPGQQDRDRDGRGRDVGRPDGQRPPMAGQPNAPIVNAQPRPPVVTQPPAVPQPNVVQTTPAVPVVPQVQPQPQPQPQPNPRFGSRPPPPFEAGGERRPPRGERGERGERADAAPAAPQVVQPAPVQQQGPMMRAQPVRREERRDVAPPPPVERPAPSAAPAPAPAAVQAPRPVEVQRPQAPQRPVEVQRPAAPVHPAPQAVAPPPQPQPQPAHQPEMRRPEPQRRDPAVEQKRGGGDRDPQR